MRLKKILIVVLIYFSFMPIIFADNAWKNIYHSSNMDSNDVNLDGSGDYKKTIRYVRSMGYDYVVLAVTTTLGNSLYQSWGNSTQTSGLKFYLRNPAAFRDIISTANGGAYYPAIETTGTHTQQQQDWYTANTIVGSPTAAFPNNLVTSWYTSATRFSTLPDFQQQTVITTIIDGITNNIAKLALGTTGFTFAGYIQDISRLYNDVRYTSANTQTTVAQWNGTNTCTGTHTHTYTTVEDGKTQFYIQLNNTLRATYGTSNVHMILEPWRIWWSDPEITDEYLNRASLNTLNAQLHADLYIAERNAIDFVTEPSNFNQTISVLRSEVGIGQVTTADENTERINAIACGTASAWNYSLQDFPDASTTITNVADRIKLIRWIPNQDNLILVDTNGDLLSTSTTRFAGNDNGTASYYSVDTNEGSRWNSYISNKIYWGRDHRKSSRTIYACFLENSNMGTVTIPAGDGVIRVFSVNDYYERNTDITSQFTFTNNILQPISTFSVDTGSGTGVIIETGPKGRMYCEY